MNERAKRIRDALKAADLTRHNPVTGNPEFWGVILADAYREAVAALRATEDLLDPMLMEHGNRIDDNAPILAALQEARDVND